MALKVKYHYTHFIYPFTTEEGKYGEFIQNILRQEKNWKLNINRLEDDAESYNFFLPYMKKFLFPTLFWTNEYSKEYKKYSISRKTNVLKKMSCLTFEYNLQKMKTGTISRKKHGVIDFDITSIRLITFAPGICFVDFKTEIEDDAEYIDFEKVLDFNDAFRNITNKTEDTIKAKSIDNIEDISIFLNSLISGYASRDIEKIYYDKLFTYSYVCVNKESWSNTKDLEMIWNDFYKLQYVIDGKNSSVFNDSCDKLLENTYSRWQFSNFGFSRESGVVMVSEADSYNYTKMPYNFEKKYFYILLLAFYQRISLINFSHELMKHDKTRVKQLKTKFTRFTHFTWFSQISNSEHGMDMWKKWKNAFGLDELFDEVHKEYLEYYEYVSNSSQEKINVILIIIYVISVIFSGFTILSNYFDLAQGWSKVIVISLLLLSILSYPIYAISRWLKNKAESEM